MKIAELQEKVQHCLWKRQPVVLLPSFKDLAKEADFSSDYSEDKIR